jgi:hypothetical protein
MAAEPQGLPATKLPAITRRPAPASGNTDDGLRGAPLGAPETLVHLTWHLSCENITAKGFRSPLPMPLPMGTGPRGALAGSTKARSQPASHRDTQRGNQPSREVHAAGTLTPSPPEQEAVGDA